MLGVHPKIYFDSAYGISSPFWTQLHPDTRFIGLYYLWTYKTHLAAILLVASFPVLHLVITLSTANHGRATCLKLSSRTLKTWQVASLAVSW